MTDRASPVSVTLSFVLFHCLSSHSYGSGHSDPGCRLCVLRTQPLHPYREMLLWYRTRCLVAFMPPPVDPLAWFVLGRPIASLARGLEGPPGVDSLKVWVVDFPFVRQVSFHRVTFPFSTGLVRHLVYRCDPL